MSLADVYDALICKPGVHRTAFPREQVLEMIRDRPVRRVQPCAAPEPSSRVEEELRRLYSKTSKESIRDGQWQMRSQPDSEAGIDVDGALERFMNNEALLERFLRKVPGRTPTMKRPWSAGLRRRGTREEALTASHTLKGMCGNLSLNGTLLQAV